MQPGIVGQPIAVHVSTNRRYGSAVVNSGMLPTN